MAQPCANLPCCAQAQSNQVRSPSPASPSPSPPLSERSQVHARIIALAQHDKRLQVDAAQCCNLLHDHLENPSFT